MRKVVFASPHGDLMVPFVEQQGLDARRHPTSGKPAITFKYGKCVLDLDDEPDKVERLRNAKGNMKNGGNSFWEISEESLVEAQLGDGGYVVSEPTDGVTDTDKVALDYLDGLPAALPPNTASKALDMAITIYERVNGSGIPKPSDKDKPIHLRSKVVLMLDAIKTKGLYGDSSGETNSTRGAKEDKG